MRNFKPVESTLQEPSPWFVYILSCKDDSLYTGVTTDVQRRLREHQEQGKKCAKYLRGKTPLTLVFQQVFSSKAEALRIEYLIKKLPKTKKTDIIKTQSIEGVSFQSLF